MWLWIESTDSPMSLQPRVANSPERRANSESSVVQTGVKSAGCENRMIHLPSCHSENLIVPCVVTAVKSGANSPILGIAPEIASDMSTPSSNEGLRRRDYSRRRPFEHTTTAGNCDAPPRHA